jgi:hypothetical protein
MPKLFLPLIAALAVGSAAAGGGVYLATRDAGVDEVSRPPSVLDTPEPSATATAVETPTPTSTPERTPTPLPSGKAPNDCATSEKVSLDSKGRFAFCYPADMELVKSEGADGAVAVHVSYRADEPNWIDVSFGLDVEPYDTCGFQEITLVKNQRTADIVVDGQQVVACFKDHYEYKSPDVLFFKSIEFQTTTEDGKPVIVRAAYSGPDFERDGVPSEEVVMRILGSSVVY